MSDLMVIGVLRMPVTPQSDELTLMQYIDRGRQAADLIEQQQAQIVELEQREAELENKVLELTTKKAELMRNNDAMAATVERLRGAAMSVCAAPYESGSPGVKNKGHFIYELGEIIDETPPTNLNAVKRESFAIGYEKGSIGHISGSYDYEYLAEGERLAAQRYPYKE